MPTLDEIERAMMEATGEAIAARIANPGPRVVGLPIRQILTGQVVAWIPRNECQGVQPIIYNGLVAGYYRDTPNGRLRPVFLGAEFDGWARVGPTEQWASVFTEDGVALGAWLVCK